VLLCTVARMFLPRNCTDSPFTRDLVVVLPQAEGVYTIVLQSTNSKGISGTFTSPPIHYFSVRVERPLSFGNAIYTQTHTVVLGSSTTGPALFTFDVIASN